MISTWFGRRMFTASCCISLILVACGDSAGDGSSDGDGSGSESSGSGTGSTCDQATFSAAPGFEECFGCQEESCCAELQACEADESCVYCAGTPTDTACVDPETFSYYPTHQALLDCTTAQCDLLCQGKDPSDCVPGDCEPSCVDYDTGCQ